MSTPIPVRLDDELCKILEEQARRREIGISTLLRDILTNAAREVMRGRIRDGSEAVARFVASSPEAQEFFEFWGAPRTQM